MVKPAITGVKEGEVIHKDAVRTLFSFFDGDELKRQQLVLERRLLAFFKAHSEPTYYQGLNDIMGLLLREFSERDSLLLFEGLLGGPLWYTTLTRDFGNLEFDKCLMPIFALIAKVLVSQQPNWDLDTVQGYIQSTRVITSDVLPMGANLAIEHNEQAARGWPTGATHMGLSDMQRADLDGVLLRGCDPAANA